MCLKEHVGKQVLVENLFLVILILEVLVKSFSRKQGLVENLEGYCLLIPSLTPPLTRSPTHLII